MIIYSHFMGDYRLDTPAAPSLTFRPDVRQGPSG
jgi:hypothetical protein